MSKYKRKANTITIEQAEEEYKELIEEAHEKKMWLKAKGLNLWVSPYELKLAWQMGKYLFPANYWELGKPHNYLKPYAEKKTQSRQHVRIRTQTLCSIRSNARPK